jgi:ParB-like chromosome segregation protein Spo0J
MTKGQKKSARKGRAKNTPIGYHPVANLFPMLGEQAFRELCADIEAHGQMSPIWIHEGQIVDGRNRHRACLELGIEPWFSEWDQRGTLVDFVLSLNLRRRHLTPTQKATVAFRMLPMLEAEAKERQVRKPADAAPEILPEQRSDSRDQAAALVGVSGKYVSDVKRIAREAPEKLKALEAGTLTLQSAKRALTKKAGLNGEGAPPDPAEPEATRLAAAAIGELSKIKAGDPQLLEAMERVKTYVGNRLELMLARVAKTGTAQGQGTEKQLLLIESDEEEA